MRTMVAGVGNVFFGDDGFGVEVARRLAREALPEGTVVRDFGVRGIHLAYELLEPMDLLVVVDIAPRGGAPGTLYVIEPALDEIPSGTADAHGMDLPTVFAAVRTLGGSLPRVRIVACEPQEIGDRMHLTPAVERAVDEAVVLVRELLKREHVAREAGPIEEEERNAS